jgi:two-component system cell cycle response regulator
VLVAEDDSATREAIATLLRAHGYEVVAVEDGQQAVERAGGGGFDIVLLDVVMPRMSGLEACRMLKARPNDAFVPIMLITGRTDAQSRIDGLKLGADDYVGKPYDDYELVARVDAMLRIKRMHDGVLDSRKRLQALSVHDELTGAYNYRYMHTRLAEEFKRAERNHDPVACLLADVDQLQAVNEQSGRTAGDAVLRGLADCIRRAVREPDIVARSGGDEFLVLLPSTHFTGAIAVAERVWRETQGRGWLVDRPSRASVRCTISLGIALYPSRDVRTKDALLRAADTALSQAKCGGGNRICAYQHQGYIYTPPPPSGE